MARYLMLSILLTRCFDSGLASVSADYEALFVTAQPGANISILWNIDLFDDARLYRRSILDRPISIKQLFYCDIDRRGFGEQVECDTKNNRSEFVTVPPLHYYSSWFYQYDLQEVGFFLADVRLEDAGVHRLEIGPSRYDDANNDTFVYSEGILYVYQKPSTPTLTLGDISAESITVHCISSSRSMPWEYRHMVDMQYTWSLTNISHVQTGSSLILDNDGNLSGNIVSCTVQEENSTYISETSSVMILGTGEVFSLAAQDSTDTVPPSASTLTTLTVGLGAGLAILGITCAVLGSLSCWKHKAGFGRKVPPDAATAAGTLDSTAAGPGSAEVEMSGQYGELGPRDYIPVERQLYQDIHREYQDVTPVEAQVYEVI